MSPRPGKIDEVVQIDLPRPRGVEVKDTIEFVQYVKRLREGLGE
jgi:NitT/TauT family transport system ATP-binding protein